MNEQRSASAWYAVKNCRSPLAVQPCNKKRDRGIGIGVLVEAVEQFAATRHDDRVAPRAAMAPRSGSQSRSPGKRYRAAGATRSSERATPVNSCSCTPNSTARRSSAGASSVGPPTTCTPGSTEPARQASTQAVATAAARSAGRPRCAGDHRDPRTIGACTAYLDAYRAEVAGRVRRRQHRQPRRQAVAAGTRHPGADARGSRESFAAAGTGRATRRDSNPSRRSARGTSSALAHCRRVVRSTRRRANRLRSRRARRGAALRTPDRRCRALRRESPRRRAVAATSDRPAGPTNRGSSPRRRSAPRRLVVRCGRGRRACARRRRRPTSTPPKRLPRGSPQPAGVRLRMTQRNDVGDREIGRTADQHGTAWRARRCRVEDGNVGSQSQQVGTETASGDAVADHPDDRPGRVGRRHDGGSLSSRQPPSCGGTPPLPRTRSRPATAPARDRATKARRSAFTVGLAGIEPATFTLSV